MRDTTRSFIYGKALAFDTTGNSTTTLTDYGRSQVYRLFSTVDCAINFGTTAASDGTHFVLPAYLPEYVTTTETNIAAKGLTSSGTLYIACMGKD